MAEELEPEPIAAEVEPEPVAAEATPEPDLEPEQPLLRVLTWEADGPYEVEGEPVAVDLEPEPEPQPTAAEVPWPEPLITEQPWPEPIAAEVEAEPAAAIVEPVAAEAAPEPEPEPVVPPTPKPTMAPIGDTILRFPQRRAAPAPAERLAAEDDAPEVAARRAQLESIGLGDPGEGPVMPEPAAIQPYRSRGAAVPQGELAARAVAQGVSFWEASAREVAEAGAAIGVQNCGGCGLSLSASARFCRRCGTPQSRSA